MKRLALIAALLALIAPAAAQFKGGGGFGTPGFTVPVSSAAALACSYTPVTTGTQGTAYTGATPSASGGTPAYTFSETGTLPGGLSISSSTGVISGTPTANGSFPTIQVKVTDSTSTVANCGASFTLVISAPTFVGMVDVVASAKWCFSLRACSSAARGSKAVNACNSTAGVDVGCADLSTDATTGNLVPATVSGITCPGTNCTLKTWYDQTVGGNCGGTCDITQATVSARPTLVASCIGSLPCATFTGANSTILTNSTFALSQPLTVSAAFFWPSSNNGVAVSDTTFVMQAIANGGFPSIRMSAGTDVDTTTTWGTSHIAQAVFNGASSVENVDGTPNTVNPGTNGFVHGIALGGAQGTFMNSLNLFEVASWGLAFSSGQQTSMCHNQFAYWGTATSC